MENNSPTYPEAAAPTSQEEINRRIQEYYYNEFPNDFREPSTPNQVYTQQYDHQMLPLNQEVPYPTMLQEVPHSTMLQHLNLQPRHMQNYFDQYQNGQIPHFPSAPNQVQYFPIPQEEQYPAFENIQPDMAGLQRQFQSGNKTFMTPSGSVMQQTYSTCRPVPINGGPSNQIQICNPAYQRNGHRTPQAKPKKGKTSWVGAPVKKVPKVQQRRGVLQYASQKKVKVVGTLLDGQLVHPVQAQFPFEVKREELVRPTDLDTYVVSDNVLKNWMRFINPYYLPELTGSEVDTFFNQLFKRGC